MSWISISGLGHNWCCQLDLSYFFEYLVSSIYDLLAMAGYSTFHCLSSINFFLLSKTWGLRCFPCNVPDHCHPRQLRNMIHAKFKVERVVLCDISYGTGKQFKYVLTTILPVFDHLFGWKACWKICMLNFFVLLLKIGRDFQVICKTLLCWSI